MASIDPQNLRETIGRFRILIMGRANAGKTTILQKVCNTTEDPEIYNAKGDKIDTAVVEGSIERGNHDIRNEIVFKSNPGFGFFDSCGFEAGSEKEFEDMKEFISERANATRLEERIHAIWYCIPMDDPSRTYQRSEEKFFSECDTGNVPVIVVFTKFDALRPVAFGEIKKQLIGVSKEERSKKIAEHVAELFKNTGVWDRLCDTKNRAHPKCYVCLDNMNKPDTNCDTLLERTTFALDNEELRLCLVSTQQSNLELCIKCGIQALVNGVDSIHRQLLLLATDHEACQLEIAKWFSHLNLYEEEIWYRQEQRQRLQYYQRETYEEWKEQLEIIQERIKREEQRHRIPNFNNGLFNTAHSSRDKLLPILRPLTGKGIWFTTMNGIICTGIATIIVLEYSAFLPHDDQLEFLKSAVDYYMNSPTAAVVEKVAKGMTDGGYNKEELKKKIIEFILENRMSKDLIGKK